MKKPRGLFAGKKLLARRKRFKFNFKGGKAKKFDIKYKYDPLGGSPMAEGIVLQKRSIGCKQPHSALRKCVVVQLIKNGKTVTAFCPGDGAIKHIDEHNTVLIEHIGGPQGGAKGDIPGVKFKVTAVNGVALSQIIAGKKEKPAR